MKPPVQVPITQELVARFKAVEPEDRLEGGLLRVVSLIPEFSCMGGVCHFQDERCEAAGGRYHGRAGRSIRWAVGVVGRGAVSAELLTPVYTDDTEHRQTAWQPLGPVHLHFREQSERTFPDPAKCDLGIDTCWGDVTYLQSDACWEAFDRGGTPGVWSWLAEAWLPEVLT